MKQWQGSFHLFQYSSVLFSLKFENSLFSNELSRCIFRSERKVYIAENNQIKYFVQNWLVKIPFFFVQTTTWLYYYCHKLRYFKYVESFKGIFPHTGNCTFLMCIRLWTTTTSDRIHPLNIRKRESHKTFSIKSYPWYSFQLLQISSKLLGYNIQMKMI